MSIKNILERQGDKIVASYSEVVDETTGLVVRRLWSRMDYALYCTPFDDAHLEIGVEEYPGPPDAQGVVPRFYTIRDLRMAEAVGRDPCKKWGVPGDKIEAAVQLAIKAIEFFASNLGYETPVRKIVSIAPDYVH